MAASALIGVTTKIAGLASLGSLENQIYEIVTRFNTDAPADVSSGKGVSAAGWVALPDTVGGTEMGLIIEAVTEDLEVAIGTTDAELDFTIPEGQAAYIPQPAGTVKVKWTAAGGVEGTYNYIAFGTAS